MNQLLLCAMALICAIELSDEERAQVEEYRKGIIASVNAEVRGLQKDLKEATLARDKKRIDEIKTGIAWRKKRINDTRSYDAEDLFESMVNQRNAKAARDLEVERWKDAQRELANAGPVSIRGMGINTNIIGLPELVLEVQNNTDTTIEALEIAADCLNKFDEPVIGLDGKSRFSAHYKYAIAPRGKKQITAQMSLLRTTAKADVWISRVKLGNGDVWTQTKDEAKKTPYGLAKARLME